MKEIELLAPAGNIENFYSAINNGADAVYLGLQEFNARGNIENFTLDNIEDVISYAHYFGVKVYLTLNTLVADSEMSKVMEVVEKTIEFGIDAFIIQDLGLAYNIKQTFPNAVLHASTQMGICNLEGVRLAEKLGFSRVVLARETKLEEIKRINKNSKMEIEFFIQGALCVSYSGNCYISAFLCDASGNRGKCKQFCRLPYTLINGKERKFGYMLSAKDFSLIEQLKDLIDAGVCSFKIEGRARRAGYVAQTVDVYRKAINQILKNEKFDIKSAKQRLQTAFNRGNFIAGYLKNEKIIDSNIQGHRGLVIGKVEDVKLGKNFNLITIRSDRPIARGDGLKFILNDKEISSIGVNDVKNISKDIYQLTTTAKIKNGCDVALTLDNVIEQELLNKKRKLSVEAEFYAKIGKLPILKLFDKDNDIDIELYGTTICQQAQNCAVSKQEIIEQLKKGNDIFEIENIKVEAENVFIRKGELNELRRKTIELLKIKILEKYSKNIEKSKEKKEKVFNLQNINLSEQHAIIFSDLSQLKFVEPSTKLIYSPEVFSKENIKKICEKLKNFELYIELPIFANERDIKLFKEILMENSKLNIYANNYYALNLFEGRKVFVSNNLNVYNSFTNLALKSLNVQDIVVSTENKERLFNCGINLYELNDYKSVYMNFLHCPFQEHFNSTCADCKYKNGCLYQMQSGKTFELVRSKAITCNFQLQSTEKILIKPKYNSIISVK